MKYAVNSTPTTSAGNTRSYVAFVTIVKVPWWKRVLGRKL